MSSRCISLMVRGYNKVSCSVLLVQGGAGPHLIVIPGKRACPLSGRIRVGYKLHWMIIWLVDYLPHLLTVTNSMNVLLTHYISEKSNGCVAKCLINSSLIYWLATRVDYSSMDSWYRLEVEIRVQFHSPAVLFVKMLRIPTEQMA